MIGTEPYRIGYRAAAIIEAVKQLRAAGHCVDASGEIPDYG